MHWLLCFNIMFGEMYFCCLQLYFLHRSWPSRYSIVKCSTISHFHCRWTFRLFGAIMNGSAVDSPENVSSHLYACFSVEYLPHESCSASFSPAKRFSVFTPFPYIYSLSSPVNSLMKASHPLRTDEKTRARTKLCQFLRATEPVSSGARARAWVCLAPRSQGALHGTSQLLFLHHPFPDPAWRS